jgi:hypothetical protein
VPRRSSSRGQRQLHCRPSSRGRRRLTQPCTRRAEQIAGGLRLCDTYAAILSADGERVLSACRPGIAASGKKKIDNLAAVPGPSCSSSRVGPNSRSLDRFASRQDWLQLAQQCQAIRDRRWARVVIDGRRLPHDFAICPTSSLRRDESVVMMDVNGWLAATRELCSRCP